MTERKNVSASANVEVICFDTNVLLFDPQAIFKFQKHTLVIPITVIEQIDQFKHELTETGKNARELSRYLDDLRKSGSLLTGVYLEHTGSILKIDVSAQDAKTPIVFENKAHQRILACVLAQKKLYPNGHIVFVTKDVNLRVKADALGIETRDYDQDRVPIEELYSGRTVMDVDASVIEDFLKEGQFPLDSHELFPNQFVLLRDRKNPKNSVVGRYSGIKKSIFALQSKKQNVFGLHAKNIEQEMALELLLNDDIQLVSLVGKAGTGKTLLAVAAGLHKTMDAAPYRRLLISRPIFPLGKDIGYLPGTLEEKLNPWMQPIFDNIDFLIGSPQQRTQGRYPRGIQELIDQGIVMIEPLTYIRGRSIPYQFMIVDEAQNLTPHEMKTILTRAGEKTKIVLTGDCYQIDNPYVDASTNGLSYVVERFKQENIAGHVTLTKGERSPLAELATLLL